MFLLITCLARYLLTLAAEKGYTEKLHFISLGQGQGPKAEALIKLGGETQDLAKTKVLPCLHGFFMVLHGCTMFYKGFTMFFHGFTIHIFFVTMPQPCFTMFNMVKPGFAWCLALFLHGF